MNEKLKKIADMLFDLGAIKFGAFKLKLHEKNPDAPLSPIYLNLRTPDNTKPGPLTPKVVQLIAECFIDKLLPTPNKYYDHVAGVPNAGDPFAAAFSQIFEIPLLRLKKTQDADHREITDLAEKVSPQGRDIVLLVDNLITKADSKLEAIRVLRKAGFGVGDVLVVVDREQGGSVELAANGYDLYSIFALTELLNYYVKTGHITADKRDEAVAYLEAN